MKLYKTLLIISIYSLFPLFLSAQNNVQHQKDSLLQIISSSHGTDKLEGYSLLTSLSFQGTEFDVKLGYLKDFIKEAEQQKNDDYRYKAYRKLLLSLYNNAQLSEFREEANRYMPFLKANYSKSYYQINVLLLRTYGAEGDYMRVITEAKQMYEDAKIENSLYGMAKATTLLAIIYHIEKRHKEGETLAWEALETTNKLLEEEYDDRENHYLLMEVYSNLVNTLHAQGKIDEILQLMPVWRKQLSIYEQVVGKPAISGLLQYYSYYSRICCTMEEFDKAEIYCDSLEQINFSPILVSDIWLFRGLICEGRQEYDKALEWIDKSIAKNSERGELNASVVFMNIKARIMCKMGRGEEAWPLYTQISQLSDSLHSKEYNAKIDELRTIYEVDKITAEKEKNRNYMLFAFACCILLAVILAIWIYYNRQIAKKNRTLVKQIKELQVQQEIQNNEILNKTSFTAIDNVEEEDDDHFCPERRKDQLCIAIRDIILKEKAYRNPSISRDSLIERLGTNKDLFVEAFQYCFGMSFPEFINGLRLKDAITLLEQSDLSIEAISEKVGFGTVRTFQRQFQTKYDMSPKDYRKLVQK